MTSEFVKARDAVEGWVSHLWHSKGVKDTIAIGESAAISIGKQALTAGALAALSAHSSGADNNAIGQAALNAALSTGERVGLAVGTETAAKIVSTITESIKTQDAPPPPA